MPKRLFQKSVALKAQCFCIPVLMIAVMCHAQTGDGPSSRQSQDKILIPRGTHVALLLSDTLSGKKNSLAPEIVVAQDLVLDGVTVMASGEPVQYSAIRNPARYFAMPGKIGFEVASVAMTSGDFIGLRASHMVSGASCYGEGCIVLPLFFWLKGDPGKIEGRLLINATVTETLEVYRGAFPAPKNSNTFPLARIHFYQLAETGNSQGFLTNYTNYSRLALNGNKLGTLAGNEYACSVIDPGMHVLRIGHNEFTFEAKPGTEHYIRITYAAPGSDYNIMEETEGYQFAGDTLEPGSFGRKGVSCFNPLDNTLDKKKQE